MKLSDVMGAMGLSTYAEVGLVLFMGAFVVVAFALLRGGAAQFEGVGRLPLDGERDHAADPGIGGKRG